MLKIMIDSKLRSKIQPAFDYLSKFLVSRNISPDTITLWALFSGLISSILIYNDNPISAIVLLWTSGFLDVIDGSVARLNGKSTKAGAFQCRKVNFLKSILKPFDLKFKININKY
jgi:hypothetical protein